MIQIRVAKSVKLAENYSLFISFRYNGQIVNILRSLPTRFWNQDSREWEVPVGKYKYLCEKLKDYKITLTGNTEYLQNQPDENPQSIRFKFKTKPFEHQLTGVRFGMSHSRWLLADEQGLGKTKQVIDIAVARKQAYNYKHCLIVCGVNGLKWNWLNEIKTHSNETGYILGQRYKRQKLVIGSTNDKLTDLKNINDIKDYFIITNVESLRNAEIQKLLKDYCENDIIPMVAIDEIHKCKSPTSQQGKGILKLLPKCRIAMTGTPLMNTPLDLYIILRWLGYESHAFYSFKQHYCVMGGYGGYEIIGYKNLNQLQDFLQKIMLRRLKEEVLDLPEKLYIDEFVEMGSKQEQIYKEVSAEIKSNIDKIKMANNPLAELIRMRQATGYTGILSSTILESAKIDRLEELVDEAVSNNKKVVIFSNWTQMTTPIYNRLSKSHKGVVITGETKDTDRQVNVNHFQNNPECKFILGTLGAMGTGLTLTAGTVVIFMDEPWNMANKEQAIDRCHRIGTKSNITIYTLMCKNTIDERIHEIVEKKGAMSDALIDGHIVGNKKALLNYLLS